jgi:hypothetical protein
MLPPAAAGEEGSGDTPRPGRRAAALLHLPLADSWPFLIFVTALVLNWGKKRGTQALTSEVECLRARY